MALYARRFVTMTNCFPKKTYRELDQISFTKSHKIYVKDQEDVVQSVLSMTTMHQLTITAGMKINIPVMMTMYQ
jgi:lactam utilization protein B